MSLAKPSIPLSQNIDLEAGTREFRGSGRGSVPSINSFKSSMAMNDDYIVTIVKFLSVK